MTQKKMSLEEFLALSKKEQKKLGWKYKGDGFSIEIISKEPSR